MAFLDCAHVSQAPSHTLNILIACGGTGGHLFPGIAVAEALLAKGHQAKLLISQKKVDADASAKYGHLEFETLPAVAKPPKPKAERQRERAEAKEAARRKRAAA